MASTRDGADGRGRERVDEVFTDSLTTEALISSRAAFVVAEAFADSLACECAESLVRTAASSRVFAVGCVTALSSGIESSVLNGFRLCAYARASPWRPRRGSGARSLRARRRPRPPAVARRAWRPPRGRVWRRRWPRQRRLR